MIQKLFKFPNALKMVRKFFLILSAFYIMSSCSVKASQNSEDSKMEQNTKAATTIYLTTAEFKKKVFDYTSNPNEWKYIGDKPAIVDFYADWCGPCKIIAPILEELAKEYDGQIYIYKVDTDAEPELARAFGIKSIPSLLFIPKDGQPQMGRGSMPKANFKKIIDEVLLAKKP